MKKLVLATLICSSVAVFAQETKTVVDPDASARNLSGEFKTIKVSGGIDLFFSQSAQTAAAVSAASDELKEGIKTVVEQGVLKISYNGPRGWRKKDRYLRVYISAPALEKIEASGACDIVLTGPFSSPTLDLHLSGACDFKGTINVDKLKLDLSGASDVTISGTAGSVAIESSGASDVKGYGLIAEVCKANASGASDINITVNKELVADASGASDIFFKGNAALKEVNSSGASSVKRKD